MASFCVLSLHLGACSTAPSAATRAVYDLGPVLAASNKNAPQTTQSLLLPDIETAASLAGTQLLYRLSYANEQQLRPYAQARWSAPPAELLRQRLRDALAAKGIASVSDASLRTALHLELDEFSHIFDSASSSQGTLRLRASLYQEGQLSAQTQILARSPAPSLDAAGGVRALSAASDQAAQQLIAWLVPLLAKKP